MKGQLNLFEWLADTTQSFDDKEVIITEIVNVYSYPISDFEVKSTYTDIFMIINMIDDYVRLLKEQDNINYKVKYIIDKFEKISNSLAEQIQLDKEKMWKKAKVKENEKVGEDAMVQIFSKIEK